MKILVLTEFSHPLNSELSRYLPDHSISYYELSGEFSRSGLDHLSSKNYDVIITDFTRNDSINSIINQVLVVKWVLNDNEQLFISNSLNITDSLLDYHSSKTINNLPNESLFDQSLLSNIIESINTFAINKES
jgi:hypothetical protein